MSGAQTGDLKVHIKIIMKLWIKSPVKITITTTTFIAINFILAN